MGIQLPGMLYEAQAFVGIPFPTTNESALRGRAGDWRGLAQLAAQIMTRIDGNVAQVGQANQGETRDAFVEFFSSGGGNLGSLRDFQSGCIRAAMGHEIAAVTITGLKMFVIAQLSIVATAINTAKAVGPSALPFLQQVQQQARAAIQQADSQAARQLMAG